MKRLISILLLAGLVAFTSCGVLTGNNEEPGAGLVAENEDAEQAKALQSEEAQASLAEQESVESGMAENMDRDAADAQPEKNVKESPSAADDRKEEKGSSDAEEGKGSSDAEEGKAGSDAEKKGEAAQAIPDEIPGIDAADINMLDEPVTMIVKSDVNIRKGPKSSYDIIGEADSGEELTVIGRYKSDGWYYIEFGKERAFVSHRFLLKDKKEYDEYQAQLAEAARLAKEQKQQEAAQQGQVAAQPEQAAPTQQGQPAAQPAPPQPQPAPQPATAQPAEQPAPAIAGTLFIGDSRCVQMKALVGQNSWICENSKGYEWMVSTALGRADRIIGKGTRVVICLGVNDTENCEKYATTINQKAAEWAARGAKTYFVSVNPVSENPYRTEEEVEYFNSRMPGLLSGVTWIDTHSTLVNNGYTLVDGLHYNDSTNINIYNMIISQLK